MTADGTHVVGYVGARLLSDLADACGLTDALSSAMAPTKTRRRGHDRGQVLADMAVMIADGGDAISDLAVLRNQPACAARRIAWLGFFAEYGPPHKISDL